MFVLFLVSINVLVGCKSGNKFSCRNLTFGIECDIYDGVICCVCFCFEGKIPTFLSSGIHQFQSIRLTILSKLEAFMKMNLVCHHVINMIILGSTVFNAGKMKETLVTLIGNFIMMKSL